MNVKVTPTAFPDRKRAAISSRFINALNCFFAPLIFASMAYRLIWVTDPHLEFLQEDSFMRTCFFGDLFNREADAVLITGDVSDATNLETDLDRWAQLNKFVYFVLWNHDFYDGTFPASIELTNQVLT